MAEKFDIAVIGSGPGGARAARRCAQRGASVAIIEKEFIGGTCLNYGCIPSKVLLASAHTLLSAKNAAQMGVDIPSAAPDWPKIQDRKDVIVARFREGMTGLMQANKAKMIRGRAVVTAPNKIKIETDSQLTHIEAGKIIIATGSQPTSLPAIPFDSQTVISSKEALSLPEIPSSMVIIGGGTIGCELACVYAAVGTKVTIIEALSCLVPMEDQWVGRLLQREFKKLGIDVLTSQKVTSVDKTNGLAKVNLQTSRTIEAEKVLVAVGREPAADEETIQALNLEMAGSAIKVNENLQTSAADVYAVGDVVGKTYLAHGAFAEAEVAAANATGGNEKIADYSLIPRAAYTFPEIASVGKTEETCKAEGLDVSIGKAFFRADGQSAANNQTAGEVRALRNNATNKIIGITMVGAMVTELTALARTLMGTSENVTDISFPHPTVTEVLKEAIEDAFGLN